MITGAPGMTVQNGSVPMAQPQNAMAPPQNAMFARMGVPMRRPMQLPPNPGMAPGPMPPPGMMPPPQMQNAMRMRMGYAGY